MPQLVDWMAALWNIAFTCNTCGQTLDLKSLKPSAPTPLTPQAEAKVLYIYIIIYNQFETLFRMDNEVSKVLQSQHLLVSLLFNALMQWRLGLP